MNEKMEEEEQGSSPTLPADIIEEILSRLPVKFLLQFRCVSKQWRSLLIDPAFTTKHLNRSTEKNPTHMLVAHQNRLYTSEIESGIQTRELHFVFTEWKSKILSLEASCDGLVCLRFTEEMGLYNPATREFLLLPEEEDSSYCEHSCFGLGFDSITKKYKLVKVTDKLDGRMSVDVYTHGSHRWRRICDSLCFSSCYSSNASMTGVFHWIAIPKIRSDSRPVSILSFDFQLEEFQEVPLPEFGLTITNINFCVGVLGGCLSVSANNSSTASTEVWVMKEYGVKESWTKLISMSSVGSILPLGFWKDGEILLQRDKSELILYNPETETEIKLGFCGLPNSVGSVGYHPCLFSCASLVESLICLRVESEGTIKS